MLLHLDDPAVFDRKDKDGAIPYPSALVEIAMNES